MVADDLSFKLIRLIEEMRQAGDPMSPEALERLAATLGSAFGAKPDEVAILHLSGDGMLRFVTPVKLSKLGSIPITNSHSLAVKTIREKRGEFINNFSSYHHPTVFEAVDLSTERKAAPIQKIVSVPILADGKVMGVIQVSRKGRTGESAGPDFTPRDLAELTTAATILSKLLSLLPDSGGAGKRSPA